MSRAPREESPRWVRTNQWIQWMTIALVFAAMLGLGMLTYYTPGFPWIIFMIPIFIGAMVATFPVVLGYMIVWYRWKYLHPVSFFLHGLFLSVVVGACIIGIFFLVGTYFSVLFGTVLLAVLWV